MSFSITTTSGFTIPGVGSNVGAALTQTGLTPQGCYVTVYDGTNCVIFLMDAVSSSTACTLQTAVVISGAIGNTMGSGAVVTLGGALPLGVLQTNPFPNAALDYAYSEAAGTSAATPMSSYVQSPVAPLASLHAKQAAISSIIHQWRCNDAAGSTTLADTVGSTSLAVTGSGMVVGAPGLMNDGATGVVTYYSTGNYLSASSVIPTSGPYCIEMLVAHPTPILNQGYCLFCAQGTGGDGTGNYITINVDAGTGYGIYVGDFSANTFISLTPFFYPILLHMETDGTNMYLYVNGDLWCTGTSYYVAPSGKLYVGGAYGYSQNSTMWVQNIAVYNARLTQAQKYANANAVIRI